MLVSKRYLEILGLDVDKINLYDVFNTIGHEVDDILHISEPNLVVGRVSEVKKHPEADKLNIATVNIGDEELTIVCGAPNLEVDRLVIVAKVGSQIQGVDIVERSLKGVKSQGMICSLPEIFGEGSNYLESDREGIFHFESQHQLGSEALKALELDDEIYDLDLTADRGDALAYQGLFYDLNAYLNYHYEKKERKFIEYRYDGIAPNKYSVEIKDDKTEELSLIYLKNIETLTSSLDLKLFLIKHNIKIQNSIVDSANYLMFKYGRPLHTYDANKIKGGLHSEKLREEEKFIALDEKEYLLPVGTLVIKDEEKTVSVAGVIGSNETKVTNETRNVLIESAIFASSDIRFNAKATKLSTESSKRFERGVDHLGTQKVFGDLTTFFKAQFSEIKVAKREDFKEKVIEFQVKSISQILGIKLTNEEIKTILQGLKFEIIRETLTSYTVKVPSFRNDLDNENDILEELVRISDLAKIKSPEPIFKKINASDEEYFLQKNVETNLIKTGIDQVISYSLINKAELKNYLFDLENPITLKYPLSSEHNVYRQSLLTSLVGIADYNLKRQNKSVAIFEIANIYGLQNEKIVEEKVISALITGQRLIMGDNKFIKYDYLDLKGILDTLSASLNIKLDLKQLKEAPKEFNPFVYAEIYLADEKVGVIGQLDEQLLTEAYFYEINYNKIMNAANFSINYEMIGNQPAIVRDLTVTMPNTEPYSNLEKYLKKLKYITTIELIDVYQNKEKLADKKALTFKLYFKDPKKTLENSVVDQAITEVVAEIKKENYEVKNWER